MVHGIVGDMINWSLNMIDFRKGLNDIGVDMFYN